MTEQTEQFKIFVLYHHPCLDGTGAKYAAQKKFGDKAKYIGVNYDQPPPAIPDGSEVYIIDFSYPRDVLEAMYARMAKLIVLDHHKTAQEALQGLHYAYFDMNRSGAVLAWNYFFPDVDPPRILQRVQDRDLWRWQYKDTKAIFNTLDVADGNFNIWDWAERNFQAAIEQGEAINEYQEFRINRLCQPERLLFTTFRGIKAVVVNNDSYSSEIGSKLVTDHPEVQCFLGYTIRPDGTVYVSLRSRDDFDCSVLAKQLGGGGHAKASGAITSLEILKEIYEH